jgi:hypothetical protein
MNKSKIKFNEFGEISVLLDRDTTDELNQTGYCQVEDNYFVVEVDEKQYIVAKAIDFNEITFNAKEEDL